MSEYRSTSSDATRTRPARIKILRATHYGMCFGVRDAIALAFAESKSRPITILGDLVHNETVLKTLREQGVKIARQVADVKTSRVLVTAHGASQRTLERVRAEGFEVLEATCPLVHYAHRAIAGLVADGYHPVIIGRRDHVEVRGMTEDLEQYDVVLEDEDVALLPARPRFGVIAQTTQPHDKVQRLVEGIRQKHPGSELRFVDTICQPTKQRQTAAVDLAQRCDVVIVIGGASSNNTHELASTCRRHCARVHHVQTAEEMRAAWFNPDDTVGLTAGTSTPEESIAEIERWLQDFAGFQEKLAEHLHAPSTGSGHSASTGSGHAASTGSAQAPCALTEAS